MKNFVLPLLRIILILLSLSALLGCGEDSPPVAEAGPERTVEVGDIVQLDGSASSDAEEFDWIFIDKPDGSLAHLISPKSVTPVFKPDQAGIYQVGLVVSNSTAQSKLDIVRINAKGKNNPPEIVQLQVDTDPIYVNDIVRIQAKVQDEAIEELTYDWKVSGGTIVGKGPSATWTTPQKLGSYEMTLTVSDDVRQSAEKNLDLTVNTRNLVKPGIAIGPYQLGVTFEEFKAKHGPPDLTIGVFFQYRNGIGGMVSDRNENEEIDDDEIVFQVAATDPFECASVGGATFGDPFEVWIDEFGPPDIIIGNLFIWEKEGLAIGGRDRNQTEFIGVVQGRFVPAAPPINGKSVKNRVVGLFRTVN